MRLSGSFCASSPETAERQEPHVVDPLPPPLTLWLRSLSSHSFLRFTILPYSSASLPLSRPPRPRMIPTFSIRLLKFWGLAITEDEGRGWRVNRPPRSPLSGGGGFFGWPLPIVAIIIRAIFHACQSNRRLWWRWKSPALHEKQSRCADHRYPPTLSVWLSLYVRLSRCLYGLTAQ